ncbi:MAG: hypothetical protein HC817_09180 [Saprospiraceae bacterium]|nr:hypothetical protein [Saprospiraceae bacterium]
MKNNLLIGILFVTTFAFSQKVDIKIKPNAAINPTALQIFAIPENLGGAEITNIVVTVTTSNVCRAFLDNPTTTVSGVTVGANGPFPSGSDNPNNTIYVLTGGWSSYTPNVDNLVMTIPINSPSGTCSFTGIKNYVFSVNDGNFYVESGGQGVERNIINEADNIILPVTLTSFDANKIGRTTELTWKTSSERNSSHFILERSNGGDFTKIGTVKAANLPTGKDYFFIDENPLSGKNTYRLRMIDLDGKRSFQKCKYSLLPELRKLPFIQIRANLM